MSSTNNGPRKTVSRKLLKLLEKHDAAGNTAGFFYQHLWELLSAAARDLETDVELSTTAWGPVLRIAKTIFLSAKKFNNYVEQLPILSSSPLLLFKQLSKVISLVCEVLAEDCPTTLGITRFLESLREATSNLSSSTHYVVGRESEITNLAKAETLKLWLDTITTELGAIRLLLPEDTPVFTCPFPLTGCTYQTTNLQQWIVHKDQCCERRWTSKPARLCGEEAGERLDSCYRIRANARSFFATGRVFAMLWHQSSTPTRSALRGMACGITRCLVPYNLRFTVVRDARTGFRLWLRPPPPMDHGLLVEAIYRIVWLELLRLFGLCMLSAMPLCSNLLGFVVCWLTILRSVSMWKCRNIGGWELDLIELQGEALALGFGVLLRVWCSLLEWYYIRVEKLSFYLRWHGTHDLYCLL
jgi:hypothetical protein